MLDNSLVKEQQEPSNRYSNEVNQRVQIDEPDQTANNVIKCHAIPSFYANLANDVEQR